MASRTEIAVVNVAGLVQGIVLVTFPAASTIFTSSQAAAYPLLLVATGFLGAGFGLTVPVLNTFTSVFSASGSSAGC